MLKKTVVTIAAAALLGVAMSTQTARAWGYDDFYDDDDFFDLMNPGWWFDEMFDDDDDEWYYRHHRYNPYWGGPYGWGGGYGRYPRVYIIQQPQPAQQPEPRVPE